MPLNPHYNHGLLWRAIAVSLLLHALLLLQPGFDSSSSHSSAPQSLMAMLRVRAEPAEVASSVPLPSARAVPHTVLKGHEVRAPEVARQTSSASPAKPLATLSPTTNEVVGLSTIADSPANISVTNNTAPSTVATDLDFAEGKKAYLFAIRDEAARVKKYPARAFAAGWTGVAVIHIEVATGGNVQTPQLSKSSGYADIDSAALSFVGIALKRTPVPEHLRERAFTFDLPVSFTIKDN